MDSNDPFESGKALFFYRKKFLIVLLCLLMAVSIIPQGFRYYEMLTNKTLVIEHEPEEKYIFEGMDRNIVHLNRESLLLILQAYNAGPGKVDAYNGTIRYPETISYVERAFNLLGETSIPTPYDHIIEEVAPYFGLDPHLVKTVVLLESGGEAHHTSHRGARGLMQLTYPSWQDMTEILGVDWSFDEAYDPYKNIVVGCAYLAWLRDAFVGQIYT